MNDRQVFVTILGGILFAIGGGVVLLVLAQLIARAVSGPIDGGDDIGWGLLWLLLTIISGIFGSVASARWARKRYSDSRA